MHFGESGAGTLLSAALLAVAASLCLAIAVDPRSRSIRRFWVAAGAGFGFLIYDELGMLHETVGRYLRLAFDWDRGHRLTRRLDDVIVLLYGCAAAWWAFRYREHLLRLRWTTSIMALAGVAFALTVIADLARGWRTTEEAFKIAAEALIVAGLLAARVECRSEPRATVQTVNVLDATPVDASDRVSPAPLARRD